MKPIAMKCSQEQFEDIKPILMKHKIKISEIDDFHRDVYLVNNFIGIDGIITNLSHNCKSLNDRTVFEEWNKDIFLEYCDIKTKSFKLLRR